MRLRRKMDQAAFSLILLSGTFEICSSALRQYHYVNQMKTWQEAQSYCRANYIDLATVDGMQDVNSMNDSVKSVDPGYGGAAWIGLQRSWAWSTGESFNNNTAWASYQPNEGTAEAACGLFCSTGWSDYYCSNRFYFYCFDDSPTAINRFKIIKMMKNWTEAQTYCKQYYTDLAIINSTEDYATFAGFSGLAWIGLISSQWSDGGFSIFRYWAPGNAESSLVNKCSAMVVANSGKWISTGCNVKLPFICYGEPPPITRHYHYMAYPRSWFDAQSYCRAKFTDLATIDSFNDLNSLMNQVDEWFYSGSLWIGLSRGTNAQWGWSQGDEPLSSYSNWDSGIPNGSGECVVNINNVWRDYDCTVPLYFVCYYEGNGYIMVESTKTWKEAQSYCRSSYTDLVTIRSPWEQKQLIELVGRGVFVWIGLFLDTWDWSDQGSLFFRNWALGQPSSTSGNCTAVMTSDSGKWTAQNCNAALPFICYDEKVILKRKTIIRIKMSYSGTANLNDPSMQAMILKEIEKKLAGQSMAKHTNLSWNLMSDGNVFVKKRARDKS